MRSSILLFAKAPRSGRVKTRLQPDFTAKQAAELHESFVRDMVAMLQGMTAVADLELHTDIETDAWSDLNVAAALQVGGDLGERMLHALEAGLRAGRPRVMIVGSDAPTLPAENLAHLLHLDADVALGPAEDGGYYAISCRKTRPEMFAGVGWGGEGALAETVRSCEACGLSVATGAFWYDIDTVDDVRRLARSPGLPPHTREWMARYAKRFF